MTANDNVSTDFSTPPIWEEIQGYFGDIPLHVGKLEGWRCRAKLAVRGTSSKPQIGIFRPGTHDVQDLGHCVDHHPSIEEAIEWVRVGIAKLQIVPYVEEGGKGELRYIQLVVHRPSKKVQLTLVANGEGSLPRVKELAELLWDEDRWHSIWTNVQEGATNTIFGRKWHLEEGEELLWESLRGSEVAFHPACFGQAHLDLFEKILEEIEARVLPDKVVAEYYAGVGVISRAIEDKCKEVHLIEENPYAEASFDEAEPLEHLKYHTADAAACLPPLEEASVIIFDPPRRGVDPTLLDACDAKHLEQILYLSCNFVSLKKDIERLKELGWEVESASTYLLFPHTNHLEILVALKKSG